MVIDMKIRNKLLLFLVCACLLLSLFGCKENKETSSIDSNSSEIKTAETSSDLVSSSDDISSEDAATSSSQSVSSQQPASQTSSQKISSTKTSSAAQSAAATASSSVSKNEYRNLCAGWVSNLNMKDKWKTYDWDKENKYVTASKSLECAWGNGYGKAYLFDGVKSSSELLFDEGAWVSCTVKPGWGENSGEIDPSTVTWRKAELNEYLIFDLQGTCSIDKVNFSTLYKNGSHGMPEAFTIEVSNDKSKWTVVHKETAYEQDISKLDQSFSFAGTKARYVKLTFTKCAKKIDNNLGYCAALSEVEIWGKTA